MAINLNLRKCKMNETLKQKLINEKVLYLMTVKNKIAVLEQKTDNGIITRKESIALHGLYKIQRKTVEEIEKLFLTD